MAASEELDDVPLQAEVTVEVPRFSHVKRRDDGAIDFVSPLPCPFNYGSVPGTRSADGERVDAVVLGARLPRLHRRWFPVRGVVRFVDAGQSDPKWVCKERALSARDVVELELFFRGYALAKRWLNRLRGRRGVTRYEGLQLRPERI